MSRKSVWYTLVMSYVLIYVLPIIVMSVIVYGAFLGAFEAEIANTALNNLERNIEVVHADATMAAQVILSSDSLKELDRTRGGEVERELARLHLGRYLAEVAVVHAEFDALSVYDAETGVILHSRRSVSEAAYRDLNEAATDTDKPFWVFYEDEDGRVMGTCWYPLSPYFISFDGFIGVTVDARSFYRETSARNSAPRLTIETPGVIAANFLNGAPDARALPDLDALGADGGESGYRIIGRGENRGVMTYIRSDAIGRLFVNISYAEGIREKADFLRNAIGLTLGCLVLFGMPFVGFVSFFIYKPLKNMKENLKRLLPPSALEARNEFDMLDRAVSELGAKELEARNLFVQSKKSMEENFARNLLEGQLGGEEEAAPFRYPYFTVVVVEIDHYEDFERRLEYRQQYAVKQRIRERFEAALRFEAHECFALLKEKQFTFLVNHGADGGEAENELERRARAAKAAMDDCSLTVAVSGRCAEIREVRGLYADALRLIGFKLLYGLGRVYTSGDLDAEESRRRFYYPFSEGKRIYNCLKSSLTREITANVKKIVYNIRETYHCSNDNIMTIFIQLLSDAHKFLMEEGISADKVFARSVYGELARLETLDEMEAFMTDVYAKIIERIELLQFDTVSVRAKNIVEYLRKNYKRDISIADISEAFGVSYSHIRKIFSEATGETIVGYINVLRVNEAKRLLRTDRSVAEIAAEVGYNNSQSLMRMFKKLEGIPPGKYRELKM